MYKQIIVLLAIAAVSQAQVTGWVDCGKFNLHTLNYMQHWKKITCTQEARQLLKKLEPAHAPPPHAHSFEETLTTLHSFQLQVRLSSNIILVLMKLMFPFLPPASAASSLPYTVSAVILGQPWVIMQGNGCDQLPCPTTPGQSLRFEYRYTVTPEFPPVRLKSFRFYRATHPINYIFPADSSLSQNWG